MPTLDFINVKQRNRLDSLVTDVTPNSPPEVIAQVRDICKKEFEKHPDDFDPTDIERFMGSDWTVTRFLLRKKDNIEDAAKMMISCARWRHRLGMPRWKDEDFPDEFYRIGCVFPYTEDLLGNTTIYVRAKLYDKKLGFIQELFRHFLLHVANRVDNERDGRGWSIVFDCSGAGVSSIDINMILFMINEVIPNLPKGLNYVLIHDLPWLLGKIINTAVACLPSEYKKLVKNSSSKDIKNWIAKESLPDFMGGTCDVNYRRPPKGVKTFRQMAEKLKLSEKELDSIYKFYQPHLDEAEEAAAARKRASRGVRRRSSVLDLWYWMKNKMDGGGDNPEEAGSKKSSESDKKASRKISTSQKDGPKLEVIPDESAP